MLIRTILFSSRLIKEATDLRSVVTTIKYGIFSKHRQGSCLLNYSKVESCIPRNLTILFKMVDTSKPGTNNFDKGRTIKYSNVKANGDWQ